MTSNRILASGNEAVARGAYESGCRHIFAYPGTPSTQILETMSGFPDVYSEWSINEKVAAEAAIGTSISGSKALLAMKHVGFNVAADPLFAASYIDLLGGLVIVSCDDPGANSSQNEQDSRYYAEAAKIPMLEPSDAQEAKDLTKLAFFLSERYKIPFLIRMTTRICHSKSILRYGKIEHARRKKYKKNLKANLLLPILAVEKHRMLEKKLARIRGYNEKSHYNRIELLDAGTGIITSGISYQYAKEVFPTASILKLASTFPLPENKIIDFSGKFKRILLIEEGEHFLEKQVRSLGIKITGMKETSQCGELSPDIIKHNFGLKKINKIHYRIAERSSCLCPGCPHRGVLYLLKELKLFVAGDIGCYGLGAFKPFEIMDTCASMGSSIGFSHGLKLGFGRDPAKKPIALIGDSTFFHSGIPAILNSVYNKGWLKLIVLDNKTTAMTGHQINPGSDKRILLKNIIKACGINDVCTIDAFSIKKLKTNILRILKHNKPSALIVEGACGIMSKKGKPAKISVQKCSNCKVCLKIACPAIRSVNKRPIIDPAQCCGCGLCVQICPTKSVIIP